MSGLSIIFNDAKNEIPIVVEIENGKDEEDEEEYILYKGTSQEIRLELIEEEIEEKNNEINDIRKKILDSENKNEKNT